MVVFSILKCQENEDFRENETQSPSRHYLRKARQSFQQNIYIKSVQLCKWERLDVLIFEEESCSNSKVGNEAAHHYKR